jgi:dihydrofolate synthase/folylpolyglutamate synthase
LTTPEAAVLRRLREVEKKIFARRPEHSIKPSLDRIAALVTLLGDPQRACPVIHLTGTNGKTSTARMTEALLRSMGLRTGLFTSPHLSSVTERIRIDGEPLSPERFVAVYDDIAPYLDWVDRRQPFAMSFFEVLTGMAFAAFADAPVDVAVLEVGMGGTWDATNVADGAVAVITPVSLDHTQYLGSTVEEIAAEKAGIIKPGAAAVLGRQPPGAARVLLRRAAEAGASVAREGAEFGVASRDLAVGGQLLTLRGLGGTYPGVLLPLFGPHQASNAACALAAVEAFRGAGGLARAEVAGGGGGAVVAGAVVAGAGGAGAAGGEQAARGAGFRPLGEDLVRAAFAQVTSPGRLEVVRRHPVVLVDAAHNPAGMSVSLAGVAEAFGFTALIVVLAVSADKDVAAILAELAPHVTVLVAAQNSSPRSMPAAELGALAERVAGPGRVRVVPRLGDAIETAAGLAAQAAEHGAGRAGVLVTGSVMTAGEARSLLGAGGGGAGAAGERPGAAAWGEPRAGGTGPRGEGPP